MERICNLNTLDVGDEAEIIRLDNTGSIRRRLFDLGIIEGNEISCVVSAPLNDPRAYLVKGAVIAIRQKDSEKIIVRCKNG